MLTQIVLCLLFHCYIFSKYEYCLEGEEMKRGIKDRSLYNNVLQH